MDLHSTVSIFAQTLPNVVPEPNMPSMPDHVPHVAVCWMCGTLHTVHKPCPECGMMASLSMPQLACQPAIDIVSHYPYLPPPPRVSRYLGCLSPLALQGLPSTLHRWVTMVSKSLMTKLNRSSLVVTPPIHHAKLPLALASAKTSRQRRLQSLEPPAPPPPSLVLCIQYVSLCHTDAKPMIGPPIKWPGQNRAVQCECSIHMCLTPMACC